MSRAETAEKKDRPTQTQRPRRTAGLDSVPAWGYGLAAVLAALVWSYWTTIVQLVLEWQRNQDYSVGMLVPPVAVILIWLGRNKLQGSEVRPCGWGLALILAAFALRKFGLDFLYESLERYSLVLSLIGVALLVLGWRVCWRLRWVMLFLFLMVPLPGAVHNRISGPLQSAATSGAVFLLEVFGVDVLQEGNVIILGEDTRLAVAEACSGLRMLTAFVVVSYFMACVIKRPAWQKVTILLSSIPIAIVCNILRLVITALLYLVASSATAETFFHDFAGITMMPMALLILVGEIVLLNRLVITEGRAPSEGRRARRRARPTV